jgi:hypothetical protein
MKGRRTTKITKDDAKIHEESAPLPRPAVDFDKSTAKPSLKMGRKPAGLPDDHGPFVNPHFPS